MICLLIFPGTPAQEKLAYKVTNNGSYSLPDMTEPFWGKDLMSVGFPPITSPCGNNKYICPCSISMVPLQLDVKSCCCLLVLKVLFAKEYLEVSYRFWGYSYYCQLENKETQLSKERTELSVRRGNEEKQGVNLTSLASLQLTSWTCREILLCI